MSIFSERLLGLKVSSGKTQVQLAEDLGVTPQAFSYYVKGREPSFDKLIQIANYFGVTTDYLLGVSDKAKSSFENYEDVAKILLDLRNASVFETSFSPILATELNTALFWSRCCELSTFFEEYFRMCRLLKSNQVTNGIFESWLQSEMVKLRAIPLPEHNLFSEISSEEHVEFISSFQPLIDQSIKEAEEWYESTGKKNGEH